MLSRASEIRARWGLRTDLVALRRQVEDGTAQARAEVRKQLQEWQTWPEFSGLRDTAPLAKLPAAERKDYERLWADVAALLEKAK